MKISKFSGGEIFVQLDKDGPTEFRFDIRSSDDLMTLMNIVSAFKHKGAGAIDVTIPYLPYARQDRVCAEGQAFSAEMFANMLNGEEPQVIIETWDLHSDVPLGLHDYIESVPSWKIIKGSRELTGLISDSILICPDDGARERVNHVAVDLHQTLDNVIYCDKTRNPNTGDITATNIYADDGSLKGKTCVIVDDICDGGYTFTQIAKILKEKGAEKVILYVTHGIFSKGFDVFDGLIDHIYSTDSFTSENKILTRFTYNGEN